MNKIIYKPSRRMRQVYNDAASAKFRLLEGPVRSGKSYTANDIALREIQDLPPCNVLLSGFSITAAGRNIMSEWQEMIDPNNHGLFHQNRDAKDDYITINWRGLSNKKFYVRGSGKENDFKAIQGGTFGYWYADEFTRHHESFTDMALTRLSPPFAKGLFTTNADSPYHYVKTRFIDDEKLYKRNLWRRFTFSLRDNPSLDPAYIEMLEATYTGVFYKRYILNEWCMAEGLIYDCFGQQCILQELPVAKFHVCGIDYGTANPTVFLLFGVDPTARRGQLRIWLEKEYYYDSAEHQHQKTDSEYATEFKKFLDKIRPAKIYLDPSAASFQQELRRNHFTSLADADNSVLDGIRTQARMLQTGEYKIYKKCTRTIKDYDGYSWDKRAQLKGEDKPLKKNDHTKDGERYTLHSRYGDGAPDLATIAQW